MEYLSSRFPDAEFYGCCIDPNERPNGGPLHAFPLNRDVPSPWKTGSPAPAEKRKVEYAAKSHAVRDWAKRTPLLADLWQRASTVWSTLKKGREELAFCFEAYRFARKFRLLAIGLGGVFDEVWGGKWGDLYSYFRWAILARLARTPLVCLSVGVEEINTRLAKFFFRTTLSLAAYRSFRDVESKQKAETLALAGDKPVFPDLPIALNLGRYNGIVADRREPTHVGNSPMAYCDPRYWPVKDVSAYHNYLNSLSSFMSWLLQEGYDIVLFPFGNTILHGPSRNRRTQGLGPRKAPLSLTCTAKRRKAADSGRVFGLSFTVRNCSYVSASRRYSCFARKYSDNCHFRLQTASDRLMEDMEMTEYLLNIRRIELPPLISCFRSLQANQSVVRQTMKQQVAKYRLSVMSQFEFVFRSTLGDL